MIVYEKERNLVIFNRYMMEVEPQYLESYNYEDIAMLKESL